MPEMTYLRIIFPVAVFGTALVASPAYAHGFGERTELPVPLGYFLVGAGVTVALSFVVITSFVRSFRGSGDYRRYNLFQHRWLRAILTNPLFLLPLKLLSVFLLGLVIATGLVGGQAPPLNFAPTFVWIIWWVGMAYTVALLGNLWALINPWKILFESVEALYRRIRPGEPMSLNEQYPRAWGIWPAVLLFIVFVWIQDAFPQSDVPRNIALMAIFYSAITLGGMVYFGKHRWLSHGEAFSVAFSFLARFSPTEVRVRGTDICDQCDVVCGGEGDCVDCYQCFEMARSRLPIHNQTTRGPVPNRSLDTATSTREFNIRPFAVGLSQKHTPTDDVLAMVVLLLATVTFDGFGATGAWVDFQTFFTDNFPSIGNNSVVNWITISNTLGVALFPVAFLLVYLAFSWLMAMSVGNVLTTGDLARAFVFSLIPIALAYNIAHFINLLLIQGQLIIPLISDPFGFDWDLFGTLDYNRNIGIINARILWFLSVGVIVLGHILAVYLAHLVAVRRFKDRALARRSQYPMLALMVIYTVLSLWIIAQPIVK